MNARSSLPLPVWHLALLAVCVLNLLPVVAFTHAGDITAHIGSLECFAEQFWQGDWYPRWCFTADAGYGSPVFLYYPPAPFFIGSLLYPLRATGIDAYGVLAVSIALTTLLTAYACRHWLKHVTGSENAALAGACIYLLFPYRQEVMLSRTAYGELWVLAVAPLLCHCVRGLVRQRPGNAFHIALLTLFCLLCQPAVTFCILLALGLHVLVFSAGDRRTLLRFALALAAAGAVATAVYGIKVTHYMPFIANAWIHLDAPAYPNSFVMPLREWTGGRRTLIVNVALTVAALMTAVIVLRKRLPLIPDAFERRETAIWMVCAIVTIPLLFSVSAPFWALINAVSYIGFPWRMQSVLAVAMSYLIAVYARWMISPRRRKTAAGDLMALLLFLGVMQLVTTSIVAPGKEELVKKLEAAHMISFREYCTVWTAPDRHTPEDTLARYEARHAGPRAEVVEGRAHIDVKAWGWRGIVAEVRADTEMTVRLHHRYFPLWQAHDGQGAALSLKPETGSGLMLITLPPGKHTVTVELESLADTFLGRGARRAFDEGVMRLMHQEHKEKFEKLDLRTQ